MTAMRCGCGCPEDEVRWVAWHIENHRDRVMTFLGVFTSEELAQTACDKHRKEESFRREHEYETHECVTNSYARIF